MGRRKAEQFRDPSEYAGATFISSHRLCPKCKGACRVLVTPKRGNVRGIECTVCKWSQYPGNSPKIGGTLSRAPDGGTETEKP